MHLIINTYYLMAFEKIFVTAVLVSLTASSFIYNTTVTIPADTVEVEYSPDQGYIVVAALKSLQLFGGVISVPIQKIEYNDTVFSAFSYAQDDSAFAISFKNGTTRIFTKRAESVWTMSDFLFEDDDVNDAPIIALCFNADNTHLIKATTSDIIVVDLTQTQDNTRNISVNYEIKSVGCSPRESQQFTVAGINTTVGSLEQYTFDIITGDITIKHEYTQNLEPLASITYNNDGHFLYAVGQTPNIIHKFNTDSHEKEEVQFQTTAPTGQLKKVRVNKNENVIATVSQNTVYILEITSNQTLLEATEVQEIASGIPSVALSSTGGNLFIVDTSMSGSFKGQCPKGQFYDTQFNVCSDCGNTCGICAITASTCYECKDTYFLRNNVCLDCPMRCKTCITSTLCTNCLNPFIFVNFVCGCPSGQFILDNTCGTCPDNCLTCSSATVCSECKDGYYVDNKLCSKNKNGISTWLIVVLIILSVIVVGVMGVLIIRRVKARKNSPLLEENAGEYSS